MLFLLLLLRLLFDNYNAYRPPSTITVVPDTTAIAAPAVLLLLFLLL